MRRAALLLALLLAACARKAGGTPQDPGGRSGAGANACEQEISLSCSAGFVDGCLEKGQGGPLTLRHVCVKEGSKSGPPCDREVAETCPEGQVDACLASPPAATTHLCVVPVAPP